MQGKRALPLHYPFVILLAIIISPLKVFGQLEVFIWVAAGGKFRVLHEKSITDAIQHIFFKIINSKYRENYSRLERSLTYKPCHCNFTRIFPTVSGQYIQSVEWISASSNTLIHNNLKICLINLKPVLKKPVEKLTLYTYFLCWLQVQPIVIGFFQVQNFIFEFYPEMIHQLIYWSSISLEVKVSFHQLKYLFFLNKG